MGSATHHGLALESAHLPCTPHTQGADKCKEGAQVSSPVYHSHHAVANLYVAHPLIVLNHSERLPKGQALLSVS